MDSRDPRSIYQARLEHYQTALSRKVRFLRYIGLLRLVVFVFVFYFLVLAIRNEIPLLFGLSGLMVIMFFLFVGYHKRQSDERNLLRELVRINELELKCLDHDFSGNDPGNDYTDSRHPWSFDLDIFGIGSLYQFIGRTRTPGGNDRLAALLSELPAGREEITERQDISRELSEKTDFRQYFTAYASLMDDSGENTTGLLEWSKNELYIQKHPWLFYAALFMSCASLATIITGLFNPAFFELLWLVLAVNGGLLGPFLARTSQYQSQVSKKHGFLRTYAVLLRLIHEEKHKNSRLKGFAAASEDGITAVKKLSGLLDLFDQRLNLLMGFVLNALFLFDFIMLHFIARWKKKYAGRLEEWITIVSETEACVSLAGFAFNHPEFCYPEITEEPAEGYAAKEDTTEEDTELEGAVGQAAGQAGRQEGEKADRQAAGQAAQGIVAEEMGHPLIPGNKRVDNSVTIEGEKMVLITGANMAGKSTFLRAVGVNMVLAYAGCPVCAKKFSTGFYRLCSSMRTSDSLKDEESYFLAEIRRLKEIVERMEQGEKLLILLDEVLKGTNTTDKQKGSRGLIMKSMDHNILCFIATHDLALGKMEIEFPGKVVNYCFESYLGDGDLSFDYTMRRGIAKNMNASFLMKKMGIMD